MQPVISVIMPVYNVQSRISMAIESVINQTYNNLELILVNDGSLDKSGEICDYYAKQDNRIKVIHQENLGVSAARNRGIEESTGKYINFIDADDTISMETFELLIEYLKDNNYDMIIYGISFDYYNRGVYLYSSNKAINRNIIIFKETIKNNYFDLYDANYLSSSCNKLIKKSIILDNNIRFDTNMAILEDLKFTLDILNNINKIIAINKPLYKYYNELSSSKLAKRPNIDYMNNFIILDKSLRKTMLNIGLESIECQGRINCMITRYYLIYLEYLFSIDEDLNYKYKMLGHFINNDRVMYANNRANCSGLRLQLIRFLLKYNCKITLFIAFYINNFVRSLKINNKRLILNRY